MSFLRVIEGDPRDRLSLPGCMMDPIHKATARKLEAPDRLTSLLKSYPEGGALTMIIRPDDGCKEENLGDRAGGAA